MGYSIYGFFNTETCNLFAGGNSWDSYLPHPRSLNPEQVQPYTDQPAGCNAQLDIMVEARLNPFCARSCSIKPTATGSRAAVRAAFTTASD
jgi:hypothetical protein